MLLKVDGATVHYKKVAALSNISMTVPDGGIVTIIGANGAGKTTMLRAISGLIRLSEGEIHYGDRRIDGLLPEKVVEPGIAHVPESRRVFPDLAIEENLRTGAFLRKNGEAIENDPGAIYERFSRLQERRGQWAKTLSGGEQQMLAIGRALMSGPKLLLLDETSMGLSPLMVQEFAAIVIEINNRGVPVVLVEQNAELALQLADYAYVLETGAIALEGKANELHENDHVRRAYLGA